MPLAPAEKAGRLFTPQFLVSEITEAANSLDYPSSGRSAKSASKTGQRIRGEQSDSG
jgi:hypothetical protein